MPVPVPSHPLALPAILLVPVAGAAAGHALRRLLRHLAREAGCVPPARTDRGRRIPGLELVTAGAFFACRLSFPPFHAVAGGIFLFGLIGASAIDWDHMVIPDLFTVGLAIAGVALSAAVPSLHGLGPLLLHAGLRSGAAALLGLAIGSALALWLGLAGELLLDKEVLGFADVKLLGAIGAFCGWQGAVFSLFGGAAIGAAVLLLAEIHRRITGAGAVQLIRVESPGGDAGRLGWGAQFPFGPMLAAAAAAYFLALHPWADRLLAPFQFLF